MSRGTSGTSVSEKTPVKGGSESIPTLALRKPYNILRP